MVRITGRVGKARPRAEWASMFCLKRVGSGGISKGCEKGKGEREGHTVVTGEIVKAFLEVDDDEEGVVFVEAFPGEGRVGQDGEGREGGCEKGGELHGEMVKVKSLVRRLMRRW